MIAEYIVEGVNFVTVVPVDTEVCGSPEMEAATITLEHAFRPTTPPSGFRILKRRHVSPGIGNKLKSGSSNAALNISHSIWKWRVI